MVIEVPRLDSTTFRMFRHRWPGLQAPQHTVLYDREHLLQFVERAGFELVDYLPYGAFPAYFYLFTGAAFMVLKGRGLNLKRAICAVLRRQGAHRADLRFREASEPRHADRRLPEAAMNVAEPSAPPTRPSTPTACPGASRASSAPARWPFAPAC